MAWRPSTVGYEIPSRTASLFLTADPPRQVATHRRPFVPLLKVRPDFTVETLAQDGAQYSDNPTFRKEFRHIVDGARTAGLPER